MIAELESLSGLGARLVDRARSRRLRVIWRAQSRRLSRVVVRQGADGGDHARDRISLKP